MAYIDRCTRFTRGLIAVLAPALVVAALGCREDAASPTAPETRPALDIIVAHALSFRQVSVGGGHTCGVTTDSLAYCWGRSDRGQIGDGKVDLLGRLTPVAVVGGLRFLQVSAGLSHTCGVTTDNRAYCWGTNGSGRLGDGTAGTVRPRPVAVAGGLRFRGVTAGHVHTCGVTTGDRAYCWGFNRDGRLGDGTTVRRLTPVPVAGGLRFRQVNTTTISVGVGVPHTCGTTTRNVAYCWGLNGFGQIGDGTTIDRLRPVPVAGGLRFRHVRAGDAHTCGVTTDDRAYCWGNNIIGQLGDGTTTSSPTPVAVAGGLQFGLVRAGWRYTCTVTRGNLAYCWGLNASGLLGDGTTTDRSTPVAVAGGLKFRSVSAGSSHTCGVTTGSVAYCWGTNNFGQLGDGTRETSLTPTPVSGPTELSEAGRSTKSVAPTANK
jgi:alpha-tubulin suppressor-like RCC1 family protein